MNKFTFNLLGFSLATVLATTAQDARPNLAADATPTPTPTASPTPTPAASATPTPPAAAAGDESTMADDISKVNGDLANDPLLYPNNGGTGYPAKTDDAFDKLDEKRPFGAQPPSPANGITLDLSIQTALERNADILKQIAEIKRTRGQVVEVRAQALPQLGVSSSYNQSRTSGGVGSSFSSNSDSSGNNNNNNVIGTVLVNGVPLPVTSLPSGSSGTNFNTSGDTESKSWNVNFEVTQVIYSGGQISAALRAARVAEDSSFYQLRDTVDTVIATVRQQFYTVLLNRALISVQEESVTLLQSQLRDQKNRFEAGTVPRFNVLRAEVALANAQPDLIRARNNYRTAQLQLAKLVGVSWPTTTDLTPFPIKGLLTYDQRKPDLQASIDQAKERRAFLKVQRQSILTEVEQIKIALAGYQPTVNSNLGYQYRNDGSSESLKDTVDGWFFGFSGNWNIFDGFATNGRVQQARARLESARVNYADSERQVELEVQTSYSSLIEGKELIESQQKAVEQAQEALRLASERLAAGAGTQLEVLDARVSLTQAQTTALQALSDYNSTSAEFDRVTGATTNYHDTFQDPLTDKKSRKKWIAKMNAAKPTKSDDEIRQDLMKRRDQAATQ